MTQYGHMRKGKSKNETEKNPHQPDDPQIPRPDLRFVRKTATRQKTDQEPKTNTHKRKDLPKTQWYKNHCVYYKNMQDRQEKLIIAT